MKKVGKIYSAVDCDELEIGDIVHLTNFPKDAYSDDFELNYIYEDDVYPFFRDGIIFAFGGDSQVNDISNLWGVFYEKIQDLCTGIKCMHGTRRFRCM